MANHFIRNKKILFGFFILVGILSTAFFLFLNIVLQFKTEDAFINTAITSITFIFISLSMWYPTSFISLENHSWINIIFSNTVIAVVANLLWVSISFYFISSISWKYENFFLNTIFFRSVIGFLLFVIIIIFNYLIIYYNNFKNKIVNESNLNSLISDAELKSLKYQINPHFIFNALNSISSLTITDSEKAQEMSINLSNFFRNTLAVNDINRIKLKDEIENINLYLKIEMVRFEERLEFNLEVSNKCKNYFIPNMILQPLVENAIKHGVYESSKTVTINLKCHKVKNHLEIIISNNYDSSAVSNIGEGIGLSNINSRLKLIYKQPNLISISRSQNMFKVILLIPIEEDKNEKQNA